MCRCLRCMSTLHAVLICAPKRCDIAGWEWVCNIDNWLMIMSGDLAERASVIERWALSCSVCPSSIIVSSWHRRDAARQLDSLRLDDVVIRPGLCRWARLAVNPAGRPSAARHGLAEAHQPVQTNDAHSPDVFPSPTTILHVHCARCSRAPSILTSVHPSVCRREDWIRWRSRSRATDSLSPAPLSLIYTAVVGRCPTGV